MLLSNWHTRCLILLNLMFYSAFGFALNLEPQQTSWTNWNHEYTCPIHFLYKPSSQQELMSLINEAYSLKKKVKILGAGHSINAIAFPENESWVISLENYNKILDIDLQNQTITVQGGITLKTINEVLDEKGFALENLGSISEQTIGGLLQTSTHGTGKTYGPLHTQVIAMTIINGKGELKKLTPSIDSQLFYAYQCGLGSLGVIDTITLRISDSKMLHEETYPAHWPDFLNQIDELLQHNHYFRFYWFPYTDTVGVSLANITNETKITYNDYKKNPASFKNLIEKFAQEKELMLTSLEDVLELGPNDPQLLKQFNHVFFEADYSVRSERIDRKDHILNFDCTEFKHCHATETSLPFHKAKPFLLELQNIIEKNNYPAHTAVEVRFVKADSAFLSLTYSENLEDLFCLVSVVSIDPNGSLTSYQPFFNDFDSLSKKYQGRSHWGKVGSFQPSYLRSIYPKWDIFRKIQEKEDPCGIFLNEFVRKILER